MENQENKIPPKKVEGKIEADKWQTEIETAKRILKNLAQLDSGDEVLILTGKITNLTTLEFFKKAIEESNANYLQVDFANEQAIRIADNHELSVDEFKTLYQERKLVLKFCAADEHRALTEIFTADLDRYQYRLLLINDLEPESFSANGANNEDPEALAERLNKMEAKLDQATGLHLTTSYGTDLWVGLRPFKERRWAKETGSLKPGSWENLPVGEIFTTPDEKAVNGTLFLPVLESFIVSHQGVDEYVRLTIKDGVITEIQGGDSARILRQTLEKQMQTASQQGENPWNVLRIAEIAFGANSKARSTVSDPTKDYQTPAVSSLEAEKRLGTVHLAFGGSQHGAEGAEGFEDAPSHYDFVLPRNGLTVEMFKADKTFKAKASGERIISHGGINFI